MQPVKITAQPFKAIEGIAAAAIGLGGAAAAGTVIWHDTHRKPGEDAFISKGKFAAYMGGSIALGVGLLVADKRGGMDALARLANDVARNPAARTGAAVLSGAALGGTMLALPGMLAGTGWGWIALAAPED